MDGQSSGTNRYNAACPICGGPLGTNRRQKYCGSKCRMEAWKARTFKKFIGSDGTEMLVRIRPKESE